MSNKKNETIRNLTAGTFGGMLQAITGHPLDTIKVRIQSQNNSALFKGPLDCIQKTYTHEGIKGFFKGILTMNSNLFKGLSAPFWMSGALNAVMFTANGQMKRITHKDKTKEISKIELLQASLLTVPIYCSVLTPVDMVKNRLQIQSYAAEKSYTGPFDCFAKVLKTEGLKGVFQGFFTTCAMRFVGIPFYFLSYESTKNYLKNENEKHISSLVSLTAGGVAGACFWTVSYPLDQLKTRIQVQKLDKKPFLNHVKDLYSEGGVKRFYSGFAPCFVRGIIANSVVFFGVETIKNLWDKLN
eukprot:gene8188-16_t